MITKVSEIQAKDIAQYLRLTEEITAEDEKYLNMILNVAKDFISNNTGVVDLDKHNDLVIVVFVLCQDMYDNRTLYVDKSNINKVVSSILDQHSINLII